MHLSPKHVLKPKLASYFATYLMLFSQFAFALNSDKLQPVVITAASVSFNRQTGVGLYQDHVVIKQGSSVLNADQLTARLDTHNNLKSILAQGKPATYTTHMENAKTPILLQADTIQYDLGTGKITLSGNAKATQDNDSFNGPLIEYDSRQQILKTPSSNQGRTTIIFNPNKLK